MSTSAFASAATAFEHLVHSLPEPAWAGPGLGEWDMRALVGHTSRSLITVIEYLKTAADTAGAVAVVDAVDYYIRIPGLTASAGADAITERGRQAGRDLGAEPAAVVTRLVAQALTAVGEVGDPAITVIGGLRIHLSDYLQTRTFELTVHGLDIARAAGIGFTPPEESLAETTMLAAGVALRSGQGATVLMALTGRAALPDGYSVV